ncbi:MAG: hypothetical protein RBG13Loki_0158 [Promethearchaeota archaeon CR_4]|nr:MAG: hypothetical protein RBG13Loki_0158 [Candidatus Lokiarchaeota archaeon CR_4]
MPILSFSVSDTLRSFIKSMLRKSDYKNQSDLIRTALTRLMNESDISAVEYPAFTESSAEDTEKPEFYVTGDVILVISLGDETVRMKMHKIERIYATYIKSKTVINSRDLQSIFYVFEGSLTDFQAFTTNLNSIKDIKNLRYIVLE